MDVRIPNSDKVFPINDDEEQVIGTGETTKQQMKNGKNSLLPIQNGNSEIKSKEDKSSSANDDCEKEYFKCGLGHCTPKWIQIFASKQSFLVIFCLAWVLQGMYFTYFVSVITTIEKLFRLQSKTTGLIMSATEIGQIGSSLLLTYYGGQGHRPKWIAWGMVLFAVSTFTCSLPHFIFGKQLLAANDLLFNGFSSTDNSSVNIQSNICHLTDLSKFDNSSAFAPDNCGVEFVTGLEDHTRITKIVIAIFVVSLLGVGMGQTAVYTLGIPYIDDNVTSRESPLYFAITIGVRILGPALGFILGAFCTKQYADFSVTPQITPNDPRWVGAWWLGLVIVSFMLMLASFAMFMFPKRLSSHRPIAPTNKTKRDSTKNPSLRDFPKAINRLLKNDILMLRTASSVLHLLPIAGLYTFLPKYLESQFRLAAHNANMVSGIGGILVMGLGIIISGVFILRVKPNARFVAAWIAFTAVIYALGMTTLMFIGCENTVYNGLNNIDGKPFTSSVCDTSCECDNAQFSPICGADGKTYFSACHAGCLNTTIESGKTQFSGCHCIEPTGSADVGYCKSDCNYFKWYIILFSLFVFVHSTSEVGSMLLILRCVDPRDKAMALGLIQFAIGLFGNVPCPIIYGAVVDSACLIWETACGKQGACWLYDTENFRMYFHGITGFLLLLAFFVDIIVWFKAGSINFVDENTNLQEEELKPMTGKDEEVINGNGKSLITYLPATTV